ncbi:hypothetical protein DYB37_001619 [Aphanomyces astaci]|uniref:ubiquitinyl hydrolase 1 n=1 Tax=Aphanomyces astaci TaxID=112090 RepID=A0A418F3I1_APHAT|nr:hypothetical protein DYB37_001619 [Aphanomyces astaci]
MGNVESVHGNAGGRHVRANQSGEGAVLDTGLEELEQLREGFRRVTSLSRNAPQQQQHGMEKDTFRIMVLHAFPRLPKTLGERLFDVLNTERSGLLQWSELLSGLDLTQHVHGNKALLVENQCKFLFDVYDLSESGQLQRDILDRFANVIYGVRGIPSMDEALQALFDKPGKVPTLSYADFSSAFREKSPAFLFTWLETLARHVGRKPHPAIRDLQDRYNVVRVRERIQRSTLLTLEEICGLEKWFQRALRGRLTLRTADFLLQVLEPHVSRPFCDLLAPWLGDKIDFASFCALLSNFCRGHAQRSFLFQVVQVDGKIPQAKAALLATAVAASSEAASTVDETVFTDLNEDQFGGLQLSSLDQFADRMAVAACCQFDCCLRPQDPTIESRIIDARWTEYDQPHVSHVWYLVDSTWWYNWCGYTSFHPLNGSQGGNLAFPTLALDTVQQSGLHLPVGVDETKRPGPMKNWSLQYRHGSRRLKLDMVLLPEPVYTTLGHWYGGGPSFGRTYLASSMELELYPLVLRVGRTDVRGDVTVSGEEVVVGRGSRAGAVLQDCCHVLIVRDHHTRLWCTTCVSKVSKQLTLNTDQGGKASGDRVKAAAAPSSCSYGLVGLDNLGNTCYMSSAIQCLSHSRLLCDYFRSGHFRYDLNLTNKLGTQGKLAVAFGNLVNVLWSTNKKSVAPVQFRNAVAKFNQHFDNYDQHDSQELLACLLSGLSEDLNRVKDVPAPMEQPDSAGQRDSVVADQWWQNYLRREVSIVVALFMGQYKSLLSCHTCQYQSASFEPFTFLQLPLRETDTFVLVLTVVFHCGREPMRCSLELRRDGVVADIKRAVARQVGFAESTPLMVACINSQEHTIQSVYPDQFKLSLIKEQEQVVAYELEVELYDAPEVSLDTRLHVGDAVGVQNDRSPVPTHARITACNANGTYDIAFWTGRVDFGYSRTRLVHYGGSHVFLNVVHRRLENATVFFTDPNVLRLFGTPLVVAVVPQRTTGYQLYTFGFCLRLVTMDGMACSRCPWLSGCRGGLVISHPDALLQVCGRETIAIDWDIQTMAEDYDATEASKVQVHASFEKQAKVQAAVLSLQSCLKDFTASEPLDEAYCSRCKALTPAAKKMDLWRVPPLLVIQLKRFQYTATSRKKLRHLVQFPLKGLDLTEFLVRSSPDSGLQNWQFLGGKLAPDQVPAAVYDLYAVVNHIGVLGGGHYVATVLSESDKRWKCFNDHQCRDIDEKDVVTPSAYILFYIRRDMKSLPVHQVFPVNSTSTSPVLSDEEMAALLHEPDSSRCVVS